MSKKMNFERHFGSGRSIISARFEYDAEVDRDHDRGNKRIAAIMRNMPLHRRELIHYEVAKKGQATKLRRNNTVAIREERREAEERMEEAVRQAVDLLEFHMNDLINTRKLGNQAGLVRQNTIHDAIYMLRHKCGVTFENETEYDHRYQKPFVVPMTMTEQREDDRRAEQAAARRAEAAEQAEARRRNNREMAEKLAALRQKKDGEDG